MSYTVINSSKLDRSLRREKKKNKNRYGMQRDGDSVKIIQREIQKKKDNHIKKRRKQKLERLELVEDV